MSSGEVANFRGTPDIAREPSMYQNLRNSLSQITPDRRGGKLLFRWADHQREVGRSEDLLVDHQWTVGWDEDLLVERRTPPCGCVHCSDLLVDWTPPGRDARWNNSSSVGPGGGGACRSLSHQRNWREYFAPADYPAMFFLLCMLTNPNPNANQRNWREHFSQAPLLLMYTAATSERIIDQYYHWYYQSLIDSRIRGIGGNNFLGPGTSLTNVYCCY